MAHPHLALDAFCHVLKTTNFFRKGNCLREAELYYKVGRGSTQREVFIHGSQRKNNVYE